jgi:hypothetical protein
MPNKYLLPIILLLALIFSCGKNRDGQPAPQPANPTPAALLKLKDVVVSSLPSPYYHFQYNSSGAVSQAVFASGLSFYDVAYSGKNVTELAMNKNIPANTKKDKLEYDYNNGTLSAIRVIDKNGIYYKRCLFTFSASGQLQKLQWEIKANGIDFENEESLQFNYYANGNLQTLTYQSFAVGPQTTATYQDKFEDYDDKPNVDGFSLLHVNPFFLHLVLLPSVHLQLNNPHKVTHTGDGANYQINYTYAYDSKGRPTTKTGDFLYTNGADAGKHVNLLSSFSY